MIQFPEQIKVAGKEYTIIYPYYFKERADYYGQVDYDLLEIRISGFDSSGCVRKDEVILNSFLHELIHIIDREYCMNKIGKEEDKENIIEGLAIGLTQVFSDNGVLWVIG